ncbi:MAG TPA: antibiotic biosynthesis monooxygenase family protein [Mycobacterium sp.]|nr:antibiotic biosynthesis monooxygenase family protein [Mycobacterium sp.]
MTTYDEGPITLINVFEVEPEKLDAFIASWRERAELMSRQPGFRSLRLHRALSPDSRFQAVNVAQWESADALHTAQAQENWQQMALGAVEELGFTANPAIYRVAIEITAQ